MKINYRELKFEELNLLGDIDRTEIIEKVYRYEDKDLFLVEKHYEINSWITEELEDYIKRLEKIYRSGGFIYGAFNREGIIGLVALDNNFLDENKTRLNLDMLYISSKFRNMGIGNTLMKKAMKEARKLGGKSLYISSSNFENTVNFYLKLGAKPINSPDKNLFAKEAEDIHMEIKL